MAHFFIHSLEKEMISFAPVTKMLQKLNTETALNKLDET